jgi:hypothetical protein
MEHDCHKWETLRKNIRESFIYLGFGKGIGLQRNCSFKQPLIGGCVELMESVKRNKEREGES